MKKENSKFGELDWRSIKDTTIRIFIILITFYTANTEIVNKLIEDTFISPILVSAIIFGLNELRKKYLTDYSKT